MPKKKGYSPERYKKEIIIVLKKQHFMSTNEIAVTLEMGYDTVIKYLTDLLKQKKIKLKKVGNRRFWYI